MVVALQDHDLRWMAPHPMWLSGATGLNGLPTRPAILRFAGEGFMNELQTLTATRPEALPAWLAVPETWREPSPTPPADELNTAQPLSLTRARLTRLARARGLIGAAAGKPVPVAQTELKLYQPAQDRFYLVAAQLVCAQPGLPDRRIEPGKQERARFVLRRVVPPNGGDFDPGAADVKEYAFIPQNEGGWWRLIDPDKRAHLDPEEDRLGLFPSTYDITGRKRRLLLGAIPVARREAYVGAHLNEQDGTAPPAVTPQERLALLFQTDVTAPWDALARQAEIVDASILDDEFFASPPSFNTPTAVPDISQAINDARSTLNDFRSRAQTAAWLILVDAARFLERHLPVVWARLTDSTPSRDPTVAELNLISHIQSIKAPEEPIDFRAKFNTAFSAAYPDKIFYSFAEALKQVDSNFIDLLEGPDSDTDINFDITSASSRAIWPDFLWVAAHPGVHVDPAINTDIGAAVVDKPDWFFPSRTELEDLDDLMKLALQSVVDAGHSLETPPDLAPPPAGSRGDERKDEPWFAIRCVFERPNCQGFAPALVSAPSAPFRMASFFDPDAPARAIRIPMPLDISPAGLRKYKKSAGFVLSNMLCGKFGFGRGLTLGDIVRAVLPWPFHKDLPEGEGGPCGKDTGNLFGLFVSLSIPIVTVCAFILLIIMVTLFDMIFRWLPYLMVVIPIPGLKGKGR